MNAPTGSLIDLDQLRLEISQTNARRRCGRVASIDGATLVVTGLGNAARLGDRVEIPASGDRAATNGEIVALSEGEARVMANGGGVGVAIGEPARLTPDEGIRPCDAWLGRVVDAYGEPMDGRDLPRGAIEAPLRRAPPSAVIRGGLGPRLSTGLGATDTLLPLARGQRIGLFAGSGVGKSRLLARLAKNVEADVVVFGLIGERGRELGEFIADGLGPEGLKRAAIVVATADEPAVARRRAGWTATAVAEHFRDKGRHVLLLIDSLTRFAEAHREVALTAGETPSLRAYPPSTANMIAALAERAGPAGRREEDGAITAIYSVLVAGSDMEEPVADITRGVLDGHVILSRSIAERGRFPPIDVGRSVSRALPKAATRRENEMISETRRLLSLREQAEPMLQTGLYRPGADAELDRAIALFPALDALVGADTSAGDGFTRLAKILSDTPPSDQGA